MWDAFIDISTNLGMSIENIILILIFLAGIIAAAKDFKIAIIWWFIGNACAFIGLYTWHQSDATIYYGNSLIALFMSLVIMALSLYPIKKTSETRGFV